VRGVSLLLEPQGGAHFNWWGNAHSSYRRHRGGRAGVTFLLRGREKKSGRGACWDQGGSDAITRSRLSGRTAYRNDLLMTTRQLGQTRWARVKWLGPGGTNDHPTSTTRFTKIRPERKKKCTDMISGKKEKKSGQDMCGASKNLKKLQKERA